MKKFFHHLSGLDRMQEVKPLLAHERKPYLFRLKIFARIHRPIYLLKYT